MTSHILLPHLDPRHPATMSRIVLQDLLRGELDFSGVVVSDALDMTGASGSLGMASAAVAALRAGCDLLCLGTDNTDGQLAEIEQAVSGAVADGTLAYKRVSEAEGRVRGLVEDLEAAQAAAGQPLAFTPRWSQTEAELVDTFDVQPRASAWRLRAAGRCTLVRLEADPNIAIGATPWGPFAAASEADTPFAQSAWLISPEHRALPSVSPDQPILVIGRDIHRHSFARQAVDRLRSEDAEVLVVDMGWPSDDRRYADVATFGASLLMGRALLNWLAPESPQL